MRQGGAFATMDRTPRVFHHDLGDAVVTTRPGDTGVRHRFVIRLLAELPGRTFCDRHEAERAGFARNHPIAHSDKQHVP